MSDKLKSSKREFLTDSGSAAGLVALASILGGGSIANA